MKKFKKILLLLVALFLLSVLMSGCKDYKDINDKSIFTAVVADKKNNEIVFYAEIANIKGGTSQSMTEGEGHKYTYAECHGKTIAEARENLNRQLDKETYLSGVRALILTEDFAKEHLVEYLYRLRADETYRKKTITVITKQNPEDLLKINHENDVSIGFSIEETLKTVEEIGESFSRTTSRYLENLSSTYTGFLFPCIGLQNKENTLIGYSVVKGTTIDGFIPLEESKGIIFLKADKPKFNYIVPYKDNKFTIDVTLKKKKIKPFYENGKISFDLKFDFEARLMYGDKKTPYNFDDAANKEVTKILTEMLKSELSNAIEQAQEKFKSDYLQFHHYFRIKYPEEFEKMDWQNEFEEASFNIDVKVKLSGTWMMDYETNERR